MYFPLKNNNNYSQTSLKVPVLYYSTYSILLFLCPYIFAESGSETNNSNAGNSFGPDRIKIRYTGLIVSSS